MNLRSGISQFPIYWVLIISVLACTSSCQKIDASATILRAAKDYANNAGALIDTNQLGDGVCLSRGPCSANVPQGGIFLPSILYTDFQLLTFGRPVFGTPVDGPPKLGFEVVEQSVLCDARGGGVPISCLAGCSRSSAVSTEFTLMTAITVGASVTVGVESSELVGLVAGKVSGSASVSSSVQLGVGVARTYESTTTASNEVTVFVPSGDCKIFTSICVPSETTSTIPYTVELSGGVAMAISSKEKFPSAGFSRRAGNLFNVDIGTLVALAEKGNYANGLKSNGGKATFTGTLTRKSSGYNPNPKQADCDKAPPVPTNVPPPTPTPRAGAGASPTPTPTAGAKPASGGQYSYTVKAGDTLSEIAAARGTTVAAIQGVNSGITDPNKIFAGQVINIPGSAGRKLL